MLGISYDLQAFHSDHGNVHSDIQSDNLCAVLYFNNMDIIGSIELDQLARQICDWYLERESAVHIAGKHNIQADYLLRNFSDSNDLIIKKFFKDCVHKLLFQILIYFYLD